MSDLLMCVGRQFYTLSEFIDEAETVGVSKRIPITSIPQGVEFYNTKLFIAHPDAIVEITNDDKSIEELADELGLDDIDSLGLAISLDRSKERSTLIKKYGIEFHMGIIGFTYIQDIVYIAKRGETKLPERLASQEGYVTPVRVIKVKEEGYAEIIC